MSQESLTPKENIKSEFEALRDMQKQRELLQERWSELFAKIQELDYKYPSSAQFDEQNKFRSDRGFYVPEDLAKFKLSNDELKRVEGERDVLDRQILKRRFEIGVQHLATLNQQKDAVWKLVSRHEPNPSKNPADFLYIEEWRCMAGNLDARLKVVGERIPSFFEGIKHIARQLEDVKSLQVLQQWPQERSLRFNNLALEFSSGPKTFFRRRGPEETLPGVRLQKNFDPYKEERDSAIIELPISHGYAFPTIASQDLERAKDEMISLARKLEVATFQSK